MATSETLKIKKQETLVRFSIISYKTRLRVMAGQKKKLRHLEETPRFPEYYVGWI